MEKLSVPVYEPCGQCANGNVLRHGRTEKCPCWLAWWQSVRQSILGNADAAQREQKR